MPAPRRAAAGSWIGRSASVILLAVSAFNALSAVFGGAAVTLFGLPMPLDLIQPFTSWLWPGLLLLVVVGGTQSAAAFAHWRRLGRWPLAVIVAGAGMVLWIFVELAILGEYHWLHGLYLGTGLAQLVLLSLVLGAAEPPQGGGPADRA